MAAAGAVHSAHGCTCCNGCCRSILTLYSIPSPFPLLVTMQQAAVQMAMGAPALRPAMPAARGLQVRRPAVTAMHGGDQGRLRCPRPRVHTSATSCMFCWQMWWRVADPTHSACAYAGRMCRVVWEQRTPRPSSSAGGSSCALRPSPPRSRQLPPTSPPTSGGPCRRCWRCCAALPAPEAAHREHYAALCLPAAASSATHPWCT